MAEIRLSKGESLLVSIDGYGDMVSRGGGSPIMITQDDLTGHYEVLVWADIREESWTDRISLEDAREERRDGDETH